MRTSVYNYNTIYHLSSTLYFMISLQGICTRAQCCLKQRGNTTDASTKSKQGLHGYCKRARACARFCGSRCRTVLDLLQNRAVTMVFLCMWWSHCQMRHCCTRAVRKARALATVLGVIWSARRALDQCRLHFGQGREIVVGSQYWVSWVRWCGLEITTTIHCY